ncbi:hypothetical protein RclHR1_02780009 [Rhizophagus clarus]|uniref:Galactose oxidase n=1 Tax=Rhizophagus clarus TaxID=94130 RepID=A0A2Z6RWX9_9GLOM|nr:hypothetical protein RclHR1_02780009 [Rhizophagus clarus]
MFVPLTYKSMLVEVNCQMTPFKPSVLLCGHTATLIDEKLYILDGYDIYGNQAVNQFFYLDVSVQFNTQELSWRDLSNNNKVPSHYFATSVNGGANNNTLFLFGGVTSDQTMASVYTFNPQNNLWDTPKIVGVNRKYELTGIINYEGKFYLWGGTTNGNDFANDMLILDTINFNWGKGSVVNAPIPRSNYGATLLSNNKIIYIGGVNENVQVDFKTLNINQGSALPLSEVYLYDTTNDSWNTQTTSGKIPSNRAGFSTILNGQRIIIYGGAFSNSNAEDTTALYVLDLTNYNWYVPKISGKIPNSRAFHKANVIGKYMVVSFGVGYDRTIESDILLLDISNNEEYIWTTNFDLSSPSHSSNNKTVIILGFLLGGVLLLVLLVGGFFVYKWNKNKKEQKVNYRNENYSNHGQEEIEISSEPTVSVISNSNNNHEQEVTSTSADNIRLSLQVFKDEILQALKQEISQDLKKEISQNLKNEILQAFREENIHITKNNERTE